MQRCVRALARLEYGQIGRYFADHNELCETNDGDAFALFPSIKGWTVVVITTGPCVS